MSTDPVMQAIRVRTIATKSLKPNPHNPRMLFDRLQLDILRDSIRQVGILVPLTVYKETSSDNFVILDGQRRWICATELGTPTVPVNEVSEPTLVQNIVTMFQIHKLRLDWELMPTALKLDVLMKELKDTNDKRVAVLTGLDVAVVVRCKKLLSYPRRYQEMTLEIDPKKRVKADFFIELHPVITDRTVRKFGWFERNKFIDAMLEKHRKKIIKSVTEFRVVKQHITNAVRSNRPGTLDKRLKHFFQEVDVPVIDLDIEPARIHASAEKLRRSADALVTEVGRIDAEKWYGEAQLWDALQKLSEIIRKKLREADRRLLS